MVVSGGVVVSVVVVVVVVVVSGVAVSSFLAQPTVNVIATRANDESAISFRILCVHLLRDPGDAGAPRGRSHQGLPETGPPEEASGVAAEPQPPYDKAPLQ
jgi:hypothetical protein